MIMYEEWLYWIVPFVVAIFVPVVNRESKKAAGLISVLGALISLVLAISMILDTVSGPIYSAFRWIPLGDLNGDDITDYIMFGIYVDTFTAYFALMLSTVFLATFIYSIPYMSEEPDTARYWFWLNIFAGSISLLAFASNLIVFFMGWELISICSWQLISFWHKSKKPSPVEGFSTEGEYNSYCGYKAIVMTTTGDAMVFAAFVIIGFAAGAATGKVISFEFADLANGQWLIKLSEWNVKTPLLILLALGLTGKSATFPLQEWLPDAMAGPSTVSALIHAAAMVKAPIYFVSRMIITMGYTPGMNEFYTTLFVVATFTTFMAAARAMSEDEAKKVVAYSTMSHLAMMLMALSIIGRTPSVTAIIVSGFLAFLVVHATIKAQLFLSLGAVIHRTELKRLSQMGGLGKAFPIEKATMIIGTFTISGLPPFGEFFSRHLMLSTIFNTSFIAGILLLIASFFTAFYSIRLLGLVFYGSPKSPEAEKAVKEKPHVAKAMQLPPLILAVLSIIMGILTVFLPVIYPELLSTMHAAGKVEPVNMLVELASPDALISLIIILAGAILAWVIYISGKINAETLVSKMHLHGLWKFNKNRWYLDAAYTKIGRGLRGFCKKFRAVQTGIANVNVLYAVLGVIIIIIVLFYL